MGHNETFFQIYCLVKNANQVCLMTSNWDAKKSSDIHQHLPTEAKQSHTANHFVHSLKKKTSEILVFFPAINHQTISYYNKNK